MTIKTRKYYLKDGTLKIYAYTLGVPTDKNVCKYPTDLIEQAKDLINKGVTKKRISKDLNISIYILNKLLNQYIDSSTHSTHSIEPESNHNDIECN